MRTHTSGLHIPARRSPLRAAAVAMLLLTCMCGCRSAKKAPSTAADPSASVLARTSDADESPITSRDASSYRRIGERDLFRPLVAAPKSGGGGGGEPGGAAGGGAKAGGPSSPGSPGARPAGPPDPLADLALTGVVETTDGLLVLIEQASTRRGEFVAVGEPAFGFIVKAIRPGAVTLAQGRNEYELRLGAKEIGEVAATAPAPPPTTTPAATTSPPPGMPDFGSMSSDQRRQNFQNWWNSMSEEDRQRFRERRGGFGPGRRGPGGGSGGRGGPGG